MKKAGYEKIYTEKSTGTKLERKEFQWLLKELSEGDTLVVTKLDRFARSTVQGVKTVQNLFNREIKVHILNRSSRSVYETLMLVINFAVLVIAILKFNHKK